VRRLTLPPTSAVADWTDGRRDARPAGRPDGRTVGGPAGAPSETILDAEYTSLVIDNGTLTRARHVVTTASRVASVPCPGEMLIDCRADALRHSVRQLCRPATTTVLLPAAAADAADAQLHTLTLRAARSPILPPNGISAPSAFCDPFCMSASYYMITHMAY